MDKRLMLMLAGVAVVALVLGGMIGKGLGPSVGGVYNNPTGDISVDTVEADTFTGDLTGDVTGDVTGDLTGDVTGDVTGNVAGNLSGTAVTSTNFYGDLTGDVTGGLVGNVTSTVADIFYAGIDESDLTTTTISVLYVDNGSDCTQISFNGSTTTPTYATTTCP